MGCEPKHPAALADRVENSCSQGGAKLATISVGEDVVLKTKGSWDGVSGQSVHRREYTRGGR